MRWLNGPEAIKQLLASGAKLNVKDAQGLTALHTATARGHAGAMYQLVRINQYTTHPCHALLACLHACSPAPHARSLLKPNGCKPSGWAQLSSVCPVGPRGDVDSYRFPPNVFRQTRGCCLDTVGSGTLTSQPFVNLSGADGGWIGC